MRRIRTIRLAIWLPKLNITFALALLSACVVQPIEVKPPLPPAARVTPVSSTVLPNREDPGTIIVAGGTSCGESNRSGEEVVVEMAGSFELPSYADKGIVFLNGWKLSYKDDDHNVRVLRARLR